MANEHFGYAKSHMILVIHVVHVQSTNRNQTCTHLYANYILWANFHNAYARTYCYF